MDGVEKALSDLEKMGIVMKPFGELGKEKQTVQCIPTGSLTLDMAIGLGGFPRGRLIELYGRESSGKSTMCLIAMAKTQAMGGVCAYLDAENGFDPVWARKMGVNVEALLYNVPDDGEQAFEALHKLIESNGLDLIVVDSLAALVPRKEIENPMDKETMGLQPRLISKGLRKLNSLLSKSKTVVIFINQLREKIGVMYGNPETTPGGLAMKFYASLRLQVNRTKDSIEKSEDGSVTGHKVHIKVVKNKVGEPMKEAEFFINYGSGIDNTSEILDVAVGKKIITLDKSSYIYGSNKWVGYEKCKLGIAEDKNLQRELMAIITGQPLEVEEKKEEPELMEIRLKSRKKKEVA